MTPKYSSPGRRETSREACIRAAMQIPGRFKADGCWKPVYVSDKVPGSAAVVSHYVQVNRKYRRSGGRAS